FELGQIFALGRVERLIVQADFSRIGNGDDLFVDEIGRGGRLGRSWQLRVQLVLDLDRAGHDHEKKHDDENDIDHGSDLKSEVSLVRINVDTHDEKNDGCQMSNVEITTKRHPRWIERSVARC